MPRFYAAQTDTESMHGWSVKTDDETLASGLTSYHAPRLAMLLNLTTAEAGGASTTLRSTLGDAEVKFLAENIKREQARRTRERQNHPERFWGEGDDDGY